jgi:hypothetical protein
VQGAGGTKVKRSADAVIRHVYLCSIYKYIPSVYILLYCTILLYVLMTYCCTIRLCIHIYISTIQIQHINTAAYSLHKAKSCASNRRQNCAKCTLNRLINCTLLLSRVPVFK